jgi:DNA-directed RNA polymerase III subunit RPC2
MDPISSTAASAMMDEPAESGKENNNNTSSSSSSTLPYPQTNSPSSEASSSLLQEKWRLLPEFLKVRGLVKQHIDSYDYFIQEEIKKIVFADARWSSDVDKKFSVEYTDVRIGVPIVVHDNVSFNVTPHMCRLRNLSYSAPIYVDIKYTRPETDNRAHLALKKNLCIGYIPVMLHSAACILRGANEDKLARFQECPHDPGGYFIVKGTERVILIQEQLSKNRIIIEEDSKGNASASVTSSTHERKSRTSIILKDNTVYLRHNSCSEDIPLLFIFKGMGVVSDQEFVGLVGNTDATRKALFACIKEAHDKDGS